MECRSAREKIVAGQGKKIQKRYKKEIKYYKTAKTKKVQKVKN